MLDKESVDKIGELLHLLRKHFNIDPYETVKIAEKVFPGRPWKEQLQLQQKKDEALLREVFGWDEDDGEE